MFVFQIGCQILLGTTLQNSTNWKDSKELCLLLCSSN